MDLLTWQYNTSDANSVQVNLGEAAIGRLKFFHRTQNDATYTTLESQIKFHSLGFLSNKVIVTCDAIPLGEITCPLFGTPSLKQVDGKFYKLNMSVLSNSFSWKNPYRQTVMHFEKAGLSTKGKGIIRANDDLPVKNKEVLISSGFYIHQFFINRFTYVSLALGSLGLLLQLI